MEPVTVHGKVFSAVPPLINFMLVDSERRLGADCAAA